MGKPTNNQTANQANNQTNSHNRMVDLCDEWLAKFAKQSNEWCEKHSYYFKHVVERYFKTYISNDAFIESAKKRFECQDARHTPKNKVFKMEVIDTNSLFN